MIPAEASVDRPFAEVEEILDEGRLFEIRAGAGERKGYGSAGIEGIERVVGICGDEVAEVFVEEEIVGFNASFPFVTAVMDGDGCVEISLSEVVVQEGGYGPGTAVGVEVVGVVANHAANIRQNVG